jgi:acetylornithine/succinyldiaminopimelate/putrescine aminotransferase
LEGLLTCGNIGAVIVEPIQGRGGIRIPPVGWLGEIQRVCKRGGALLVLDEIFTGWGRTGDWFACQHEGVTPDLECVGKIMGGGFPLSACLGGRDLMFHAWGKSAGEARHTYTFLGHPVACAAAIATVRVLHEENLVARSAAVGADLLMRLKSLASEYPSLIVDVRGRGLMIGMELVSGAVASDIVMRALRRGLLLLQAGDGGNVIECAPAFVISENQVGWMVECMGKCLADVASASQLAVPGNDTCF